MSVSPQLSRGEAATYLNESWFASLIFIKQWQAYFQIKALSFPDNRLRVFWAPSKEYHLCQQTTINSKPSYEKTKTNKGTHKTVTDTQSPEGETAIHLFLVFLNQAKPSMT